MMALSRGNPSLLRHSALSLFLKRLLSMDNEELQLMGIVLFGYACCEVINIGEKEIEEFIIYKFE